MKTLEEDDTLTRKEKLMLVDAKRKQAMVEILEVASQSPITPYWNGALTLWFLAIVILPLFIPSFRTSIDSENVNIYPTILTPALLYAMFGMHHAMHTKTNKRINAIVSLLKKEEIIKEG